MLQVTQDSTVILTVAPGSSIHTQYCREFFRGGSISDWMHWQRYAIPHIANTISLEFDFALGKSHVDSR